MILEEYLKQDAIRYADKTAVICKDEQLSYGELYAKVTSRVHDFENSGLKRNQIVTLRSSQSIDFLVDYFALHIVGCVVAPLERDMPEELFGQISGYLSSQTAPEGTADILYTTGTTGKSKGVMISHRTIIADAENLIDGQGFSHDLAFVINGPLNHIGSLSKIYPVILLGATIIIVDGIKNADDFFNAFNYPFTKYATFLVPASIRILIQLSSSRLADLQDKIDFIETGAAAISQDDMLKLCQLLPKSRLYNTYASTETGIISTYNFNDGKCVAGCLGRPMKHSQIIITQDGLISCKGETLMTGYVGEPERTATTLKNDTIYTADLGRLDENGMLHLSGREDDVINVGGFKVAPLEVEDAALSYPEVADCICISVKHPITGSALKLLVVTTGEVALEKRKLALFLKSKLEQHKIPLLYEQVKEVKRTYNGKLDRKFYRT